MPRPTLAQISLPALRHNYVLAARLASPAKAMAVVKADGYGHGLEPVVAALRGLSPQFAVSSIEEACRVRIIEPDAPVLLLQGVHSASDLNAAAQARFEPVLHHPGQLDDLERWAAAGESLTVWIKINTGMNRLGFHLACIDDVVARLRVCAGVRLRGMIHHFACADERQHPLTDLQFAHFQALIEQYPGFEYSAANSAAHFRPELNRCHWTRPGIMLYGSSPFADESAASLGLRPVMSLISGLISVRDLLPGDTVGYGATWTASAPCRMGMVAVGYADGYPRHAPSGTPVWIAGRRVPLIGRVSMDMLAVDLSACPQARPCDPVELWGEHVPVDEVATLAGTIGYELLTGITARVPRSYLD